MGNWDRKNNRFVLDTCVAIKLCENPNIGHLLNCRINFDGSIVYLSSQTIQELKKLGLDHLQIYNQVKSSLGAEVVFNEITDDMEFDSQYLQTQFPTLHVGDSQILAFTRTKFSTLITCDKGLAIAARQSSTPVINPDILPCDQITRKTKSKWIKAVKHAINQPSKFSMKAKTVALKPSQKIIWRAFV